MITIADLLRPEFVELDLNAETAEAAVFSVASMLKENSQILNWQRFYEALRFGDQPPGALMLIPHARTQYVTEMVMGVGRLRLPLNNLRYVFVVGVPLTLAAEYLRIMGAVSRILRNPVIEMRLRSAQTPDQFAQILSSNEITL